MDESPPTRVTEAFGMTDAGLVRDSNEDWFAVGDLDRGELCAAGQALSAGGARGALLLVCDGMGGVAGGEVASKLAAEAVWQEMLSSHATDERAVFARLLRRAIRTAHGRVQDEAARRPDLRGMGTTVSAAGLAGSALLVAQVGDSRAYIERAGRLTQITRDQSVVSALVHAGRLSESQARMSDQRSLILQALGTGDDVDVALSLVDLRRGDRLLLCSDGLHGPVDDDALHAALARHDDLEEAARALIDLARTAGGPDNVTVVLARFHGDALEPPADGDAEPRFTEIDPNEEGEQALTTTSWVARRLAARAGLRTDPGRPSIPATGQHRAVKLPAPHAGAAGGPASEALARTSRLGRATWVAAALVVLGLIALLAWDLWS